MDNVKKKKIEKTVGGFGDWLECGGWGLKTKEVQGFRLGCSGLQLSSLLAHP